MAEQSFSQQIKIFSDKLTRTQKITIGAAVVAVVAGIIYLLSASSKPEMSVLFSELEQRDAAQIVDKLKEKQIPYELSGNGKTILVPGNVIHETRLALASEGLPQNSTVGYEIFDGTNLGMSDFVQKLNYRRALEGELGRTIGALDEIKSVRVHIVIPEKSLFDKDQKKPTASVLMHLKSGRSLSRLNVEGIQNLVASSVEGMESGAVTVVDQKGQILSEVQKDKNSLAGISSTQQEEQQKLEQYLTQKTQTLLDGVLGPGNAIVRVNAELDFTQTEKTIEDYDPDRQVVRSEQVINEQSQSQDSLNNSGTNSNNNTSNTITNYEISKTVQKIVGSVGSVKRLSVSALVNGTTKVVEKDGEQKLDYKPRAAEEMQKLTDIIRNSVGYDPNRNDQVSVVNVQFDTSMQEEELKNKGFEIFGTPEDMIQKILLVLAMIVAIIMIRKILSAPPVRKRIDMVLAPVPTLDDQILSTAVGGQAGALSAAVPAEGMRLLPEAGSIDMLGFTGNILRPDDIILPDGVDRIALADRARKKIDLQEESEITEDMLLRQERRLRVQAFMDDKPIEAARMLKIILNETNVLPERGMKKEKEKV